MTVEDIFDYDFDGNGAGATITTTDDHLMKEEKDVNEEDDYDHYHVHHHLHRPYSNKKCNCKTKETSPTSSNSNSYQSSATNTTTKNLYSKRTLNNNYLTIISNNDSDNCENDDDTVSTATTNNNSGTDDVVVGRQHPQVVVAAYDKTENKNNNNEQNVLEQCDNRNESSDDIIEFPTTTTTTATNRMTTTNAKLNPLTSTNQNRNLKQFKSNQTVARGGRGGGGEQIKSRTRQQIEMCLNNNQSTAAAAAAVVVARRRTSKIPKNSNAIYALFVTIVTAIATVQQLLFDQKDQQPKQRKIVMKYSRSFLFVLAITAIPLLQIPSLVNGFSNDIGTNQTIQAQLMLHGSPTSTDDADVLRSSFLTQSSLAPVVPSSTSTSTSSGGSGSDIRSATVNSYINRENLIRRETKVSYTPGGCQSCQMREKVKAENLASIKRHILMRLELKTLPNITSSGVPHEIIEKFYKNHSLNGGDGTIRTTGDRSMNYDMQGDDPNSYMDYNRNPNDDDDDLMMSGLDGDQTDGDNYEEEFFSVVNSMYIFPTMPRMRHNRKPDILHFSFNSDGHSTVSQAVLHLYIRGREWIRENEGRGKPPSVDNNNNEQDIVLSVNRVVRRPSNQNSTHVQKVTESRHAIPNGHGQWVSIDVTEMVSNWFANPNTNHGVVIKVQEPWMKQLVVTDDNSSNKAYTLYIEIATRDNRKRRSKRNTSLNCSESDNEERCCRYPLQVNFQEFHWDWIIAPTSFNAYFCNGECKLGFLQKYPHTHLMQMSTAPQPCCSPTKMSPIRLLYFNMENNLVMSTIPNMSVEKCSCS